MLESDKKLSAVVIIPTYNEAENIGKLIDELVLRIFPTIIDWHMSVVVVDDNSPDGTGRIVKEKIELHKGKCDINLITRTMKDGIGTAYLEGFVFAVNKLQAGAVVEFDADFQHPADMIPILLNRLDGDYDYIVGSRKMKGGSQSSDRDALRSLLTNLGGLVARLILFFPGNNFKKVTDPTTGLKVTRVRGCLDRLVLDPKHLYSRKFGYKVQLLSEIIEMGARYAEVPLQFKERVAGSSKIGWDTAFDVLYSCVLARLNQKQTRRFIKFATVGFSGYIVNALSLQLFVSILPIEFISWVLAVEVSIINNFLLNNHWTFLDDKITGVSRRLSKFLQFNATCVVAMIIQAVFGTLGVHVFGEEYRQLILPIIIVLMVMPYNWFMYNKIIWKKYNISQ